MTILLMAAITLAPCIVGCQEVDVRLMDGLQSDRRDEDARVRREVATLRGAQAQLADAVTEARRSAEMRGLDDKHLSEGAEKLEAINVIIGAAERDAAAVSRAAAPRRKRVSAREFERLKEVSRAGVVQFDQARMRVLADQATVQALITAHTSAAHGQSVARQRANSENVENR